MRGEHTCGPGSVLFSRSAVLPLEVWLSISTAAWKKATVAQLLALQDPPRTLVPCGLSLLCPSVCTSWKSGILQSQRLDSRAQLTPHLSLMKVQPSPRLVSHRLTALTCERADPNHCFPSLSWACTPAQMPVTSPSRLAPNAPVILCSGC